MAHAIATACLSDNHIYQDMGLTSCTILSDLLRSHFTTLYQKNTGNMKWKKFFYKQLCARGDQHLQSTELQSLQRLRNLLRPGVGVWS